MKYIALLNRFWQLHNEQAFQPGESHLYYCILNLFNSKGKRDEWPEELKLTDGSLALSAGVDVKFVERNRPKLEARGLVKSESAGKGKKDGRTYWLANEAGTYPKTSPILGDAPPQTYPETSPNLGEDINQPTTQPTPKPTTEHPPKEGNTLIYNEFQTLDPDLDYLSQKNAGGEILEVEAEEVNNQSFDAEEKKQSPPFAQPPPDFELDQADQDEINKVVAKLSSDRNLMGMLSRLNKLRGDQAVGWIERFVTRQWGGQNLDRPYKDLVFHCQSWIEQQLNKPQINEQSTRNPNRRRQGNQESHAETGSKLDDLTSQLYAS